MIEIDGSLGEGGGQILRTTLSLAICLGLNVRVYNIRAGRSRPGLMRQHLVCLRAAKEICGAQVTGDELGSTEISFVPGVVKAGRYHFAIGSAGSTTLVFQTILIPLLLANGMSEVYLEGGTHNGMAPSFDFINHCFLPVISSMGCRVEVALEAYGFYPSGGGRWRVRIYPMVETMPMVLIDRGDIVSQYAVVTSANIPAHVGERELGHVKKRCLWSEASLIQRHVKSVGSGNILSLRVMSEALTEIFESVGEKNVRSERVAGRAVRDMMRYIKADVPVGEHLADQIILPMMFGGGRFRSLEPSQHLLTNMTLIEHLTGVNISVVKLEKDRWEVNVPQLEGFGCLVGKNKISFEF
ncbi:MAG: RNA 3'-terminal phosphate cyclase [Candidatus Thiodiazotropha sp.]